MRYTKEISYKQIHDELLKKIRKDYGKQCRSFSWGCPACFAYLAIDFLLEATYTEDYKNDHKDVKSYMKKFDKVSKKK